MSTDTATGTTGPGYSLGDWYVVHTYAGYENKVKANLQSRISSMNMEERIFEVVIPMEDVMEIKGGKKQVVSRKVFPGYLLVRMYLDDDLAARLELDHVLHRDDDLEDLLLDVHRAHTAGEVRLHLVLVAGVGVDDVPVPQAVAGTGAAGCGVGAHCAPVSRRRRRTQPSRTACPGRR